MKRDVITISDLTNAEIEEIFDLADEFLDEMAVGERTGHRVRGRRDDAAGHLMTSLFYEPSTRTRFSFEAAMVRLGGSVLGTVDPVTSSAAKGESLADTVRVMENYADIIVMRHPFEGAARAAADYVDIPVINGGDGGHEHPTQTLCDLYTLRRENQSLRDLNVLVVGDLRNGRTVHSLVFGLARFGANIIPMPAKGFELPDQVTRRLQEEYHCRPYSKDEVFGNVEDIPQIDVVYVAPGSSLHMSVVPPSQAPERRLRRRGCRRRCTKRAAGVRCLLRHAPPGRAPRPGPPARRRLSRDRSQVFARQTLSRDARAAPAAARQRIGLRPRQRSARHLFQAGGLWRAGAHGAHRQDGWGSISFRSAPPSGHRRRQGSLLPAARWASGLWQSRAASRIIRARSSNHAKAKFRLVRSTLAAGALLLCCETDGTEIACYVDVTGDAAPRRAISTAIDAQVALERHRAVRKRERRTESTGAVSRSCLASKAG